ncbi:MAG: lipid carrier protein-like protein [Gammaproteobacteria bacterium]|nr:lipid carrier protein-like protein [Gammaproteobacteria bacterium]
MGLLRSTATAPLRLVPAAVQAATLTVLINHLLSGQSLQTRLRELDGKSVSVHVLDIPWLMHFYIRQGQVWAANDMPQTDVTISGKLQGFLQLLGGREDPDTLFFQRRLNVEGDTETGVHVKNLLDALEYDWDAHFDSVFRPTLARRAKSLRQKIGASLPVKWLQRGLQTRGF